MAESAQKVEDSVAGNAADLCSSKQREPFRHQVLLTARKFKSNWVELGGSLVRVRHQGAWESWGFTSFEEYCSKELRLKRQTVAKLTNSYSFLARHERHIFDGDGEVVSNQHHPVPSFEVFSVLADAQERGQLSEENYHQLRDSIWSDERPPATLARELTQRFPPPSQPPQTPLAVDKTLKRLVISARKVAMELRSCERIPKAIAERAEALVHDIEELASQE